MIITIVIDKEKRKEQGKGLESRKKKWHKMFRGGRQLARSPGFTIGLD
jgi:hypothetical protein